MLAGPLAKTVVDGTDWPSDHRGERQCSRTSGTGLGAGANLGGAEAVVAGKAAEVRVEAVGHSGNTDRDRRGRRVRRRADVVGGVNLTEARGAVSVVASKATQAEIGTIEPGLRTAIDIPGSRLLCRSA
jgi:hypothetical protein